MSTSYGGYYTGAGYNAFRAVLVYETTATSDTSYTLRAQVKCQMGDGHDSGSNFTGSATVNGSSASAKGSGYYSAGTTSGVIATKSLAITRTHSAQSITLKGTVTSNYTWSGKSSTASGTITVPAKPSYTISFNANGGSGAPGNQTKWYGESLTLSSTKPTRSGYDFLGWSTSSSATSATYSAGGSYTANSAATLYAVWKRAYIAPTITNPKVYRCDSSGNASDDGTLAYFSASWSVDTTLTSGNKGKSFLVEYRLSTATSWTTGQTVTLNAASGTTSAIIKTSSGSNVTFSEENTYKIRLTISDTSGQSGNTASSTLTISPAYFTMDFMAGGKGVGIGHSADIDGTVRVGMPIHMDNTELNFVDSAIPTDGNPPETTVWGHEGIAFWDSKGYNGTQANDLDNALGYIRGVYTNTGARGIQFESAKVVNGTRTANGILLGVNSDGTGYVAVNQGDAFLRALHGFSAHRKSASKSMTYSAANIDTYSTGPSVSLEPGTWVVTVAAIFSTRSTSGTTNTHVAIQIGSSRYAEAQRVFASGNNWNVLSVTDSVHLTATTTAACVASCSRAYTSATTWYITAQRV